MAKQTRVNLKFNRVENLVRTYDCVCVYTEYGIWITYATNAKWCWPCLFVGLVLQKSGSFKYLSSDSAKVAAEQQ